MPHKTHPKLLIWERGAGCAEENHLDQALVLLHPQTQQPQVRHLKPGNIATPRQSQFFCSGLKSKQFIRGELRLFGF